MSTIEIDTDYVDAAAIFEKYVKGNSDFSEMAHNKRLQKIEVISQKNIAESARSTIASQPVSCPKCGSTQIQMVQRKWSPLTGFFTNKVDRVCVSCKNKF